jgi:CheY-like chemotaxis protein
VADDERDTANMLALLLRDEGHEVQVTLRGDDALEICRLFRPDVVIADVNMPGISGYAIAKELRDRHGELAPLLIAVSGVWTNSTDRLVGKAIGFDHYLLKPCDPKDILTLIAPRHSFRLSGIAPAPATYSARPSRARAVAGPGLAPAGPIFAGRRVWTSSSTIFARIQTGPGRA